ncbi:MAG TPA: transglycosylase SLT domain-containing protein [Oscillatoriaceae cyanobacterium]
MLRRPSLILALLTLPVLVGMGQPAVPLGQTPRAQAATAPREQLQSQLTMLVSLLDRYSTLKAGHAGADAWNGLAMEFDALAQQAQGTHTGRRAALMAADCLGNAGDTANAVSRFAAVKDQLPLVADWALWRMAELDPAHAHDDLAALVAQYPDSPLLISARLALAEQSSDPAARAKALQTIVADGSTQPAAERALYLLAKQPGSGQVRYLLQYWNTYPDGQYLDELVPLLAKHTGLSADTNYRLGSYFYFKSDYGPAIRFFDLVRSPMALYRMGRCYWGLDQLDQAVSTLKGVAASDHALAGACQLTIGQVEQQRHRTAQAIAAYRASAADGGESGVTARLKLAKLYRDAHQDALAQHEEQIIISQAPWSDEAVQILWSRFWTDYVHRSYGDAIAAGKSLAAHHPTQPEGMAAEYWIGRIDEHLGDRTSALARYRLLVGRSPSTYYGWRARWRIDALTGRAQDPWFTTDPGRQVTERPIRWADLLDAKERALLAGTPGTPLPKEMLDWPASVRELIFLRQFDVAEQYAARSTSPNLKAWVAYLQMHYREAIHDERGEPWLNYPLGFAPLLVSAAHRQGVDPLLLAALVREESRFDPSVKSWVGAIGLAQLMPDTASWVSKQVPGTVGKPLSDPAVNLQLGAWYLAHTHKVFDGGSMYAVAAYNGGPGAVARWKRSFGGDPDEFVEQIPYDETRDYVRKVFTSYWNYCKLYSAGNGGSAG